MADQHLRRLERDQAGWREQIAAGRRAGKWALAQCAAGRFALEGQRVKSDCRVDYDLVQAWALDLPGAATAIREFRPHIAADRSDPNESRWLVVWAAGTPHANAGPAHLHESSLMILNPEGAATAVSIESCLGPTRAWDSTEGGHRFCRFVGYAIDGRRDDRAPRLWGGACGGHHPTMPAMQGHHYDRHPEGCNAPFGSLCWTELKRLHGLVMTLGRLPSREEYMTAAEKEPKGAQVRTVLASGRLAAPRQRRSLPRIPPTSLTSASFRSGR